MNTILQKRIEEAAKKEKTDFLNRFNWSGNQETGFKEGAIWMLGNQWISVDEALPEVSNNYDGVKISSIVLIKCAKGAITRARHIMASGEIPVDIWECIDAGFGVGGDEVTHWMPIPGLEGGEK